MSKFEDLFAEHIDGFKKRKKAKDEKDLNMEWRKRLEEKQKTSLSDSKERLKIEQERVRQQYRQLQRDKSTAQTPTPAFPQQQRVGPNTRGVGTNAKIGAAQQTVGSNTTGPITKIGLSQKVGSQQQKHKQKCTQTPVGPSKVTK